MTAAKALSWALERPLVAVNHLEAHIYAAWMGGSEPALPAVSLVASGGHTSLYLTEGELSHRLLGRTVDDAAGEAFDKVAKILRLGYPGGPAIEKAARRGNPRAVKFPRSMLGPQSADFSFSGLKTAVLYHCVGRSAPRRRLEETTYGAGFVADVAASFQEAVVDVLSFKLMQAARQTGCPRVVLSGGVAANRRLRERVVAEASREGFEACLPPVSLCGDNAAMIGAAAFHELQRGTVSPLDADVYSRARLA